jgi:chromosome segregation ATPase
MGIRMNIQTVITNLKNTIAGKERHLAAMRTQTESLSSGWHAIVGMLEINIAELQRILQDVEQCVEEFEVLKEDLSEANGRVRQLERQASDDSWITNPDRSGGQFTRDEIDNSGAW